MSNEYFKTALHEFTLDFASGGEIRAFADKGYTVSQIKEKLTFPTPIEEVRNAIANQDAAFISKASGVGKKSAERIIVDLREKVGLPTYYGRKSEPVQQTLQQNDEALDALMALGFTLADATKALDGIDVKLPVEERIRQALKNR